METALELVKYSLPALIVFLTAYVLIKGFISNEQEHRNKELAHSIQSTTLPMKMQAYERLALLLERISPESLVMRVDQSNLTASQLQNELIASVRAEFEHNLSQQIYVSSEAWEMIRTARGNVVTMINAAADQVKEDATALALSQKIFEQVIQLKSPPVQEALEFLKAEIQEFI